MEFDPSKLCNLQGVILMLLDSFTQFILATGEDGMVYTPRVNG